MKNWSLSRSLFSLAAIIAIPALVILSSAATLLAAGGSGFTSVRIEEATVAPAGSQRFAPLAALPAADPGAVGRSYALARRGAMGLSSLDGFDVHTTYHAADGSDHVRLAQSNHGIKVWGAELAVHINPAGSVFLLDGNVMPVPDAFVVAPQLGAMTAAGIAKADYVAGPPTEKQPGPRLPVATRLPTAQSGVPLVYQHESQELVIYPTTQGPVLAWHVYFFTDAQAGLPPGRWNYIINAATGAIVTSNNAIGHLLAQASGPGGNPNVSRTWVNQLDVESTATPGVYIMDTARFKTIDVLTGVPPIGPLNPISTDPAINDAHGFTKIVLDMMQGWFGHNSIDDNGYKIISEVNYSISDAFWTGTVTQYGNGAGVRYPLSGGIDVVGHEISEGFTQFHSHLGPVSMPGALLESFADITGTLAEFYYSPATANFDIGEAIIIPGHNGFGNLGNAIRYMCDPAFDGASLADAILFDPAYDKHQSNGIINKAFCRAAKRLSSGSPTGVATAAGVQRAGAAWFEANATHWVSSSTLTQGCQGVYDAATAMGYTTSELAALRDSWADVGVFCAGAVRPCDETLTTAFGTIQSPNYPADYPDNFIHTWCIQPVSGAATLTFNDFNILDSFADWVEVRDAANNLLSRTSGSIPPPSATSSLLRVTFGTDPAIGFPHGRWQAAWTSAAAPPDLTITKSHSGAFN